MRRSSVLHPLVVVTGVDCQHSTIHVVKHNVVIRTAAQEHAMSRIVVNGA